MMVSVWLLLLSLVAARAVVAEEDSPGSSPPSSPPPPPPPPVALPQPGAMLAAGSLSECSSSFTGDFGIAAHSPSDFVSPRVGGSPDHHAFAKRSCPDDCQCEHHAKRDTTTRLSKHSDSPAHVNARRQFTQSSLRSACEEKGKTLHITLSNGILQDSLGRYGYIAGNRQFQFDRPIQAGAVITGGFGLCSNSSLSLGGSTVFWSCSSGSFSNLYDQSIDSQCVPVQLNAVRLQQC